MKINLILSVSFLVGVSSCNNAKKEGGQKKPNILIIIADDMGFSDLGCYGGEISTPNLDKLAVNGLKFTNFYNCGRSWPTRASMLTGLYYEAIIESSAENRQDKWTPSLAHYLKPFGYRSYHSGKWHVRQLPKVVADAGFDRSYYIAPTNFFKPPSIWIDDLETDTDTLPDNYYVTTAIADQSVQFMKDHHKEYKDQPYFLYVAFTAPHFPLHALPEDIERYKDHYTIGWDEIRKQRLERMKKAGIVNCDLAIPEPHAKWRYQTDAFLLDTLGSDELLEYRPWESLTPEQQEFQSMKMAIHAAMVHRMDVEIGRILEQIKSQKEMDNTIVLFLSDNGASAEMIVRAEGHDRNAPPGSRKTHLCLGPGWSWASNAPLRRSKIWVHEGGTATPLIVHWPDGKLQRNTLRNSPAHVVDFLPTLLEIVSTKDDENLSSEFSGDFHGKSMVPLFRNENVQMRDYIFFNHQGNKALIVGDWKVVSSQLDGGKWELFNLNEDRSEQENLAEQQAEKVREMGLLWERLLHEFEER